MDIHFSYAPLKVSRIISIILDNFKLKILKYVQLCLCGSGSVVAGRLWHDLPPTTEAYLRRAAGLTLSGWAPRTCVRLARAELLVPLMGRSWHILQGWFRMHAAELALARGTTWTCVQLAHAMLHLSYELVII